MRILFIGNLNPIIGRSYQRRRALEEIGHSVTAYPAVLAGAPLGLKPSLAFWKSRLPPDPTGATPLGRKPSLASLFVWVLWKSRLPPDPTGANKAILREVDRIHPDIVWIEKGNTIWPRTLRAAKTISPATQLVSYSEDDMFARHNRTRFYTWGLKYYDVVFTTKSYNCNPNELPALGAKRVVFVDKAYDIHAHRPISVTAEDIRAFGGDVGFIGSYEAERASSLLYLAKNGIPVRIWGPGRWHKLSGRHPNLVIENRPLYGDDYARGFCATRINLCFLRKMNRDLQTDRTMEIPACGAFMLAERTEEHLRLFEEGKEAAYFGSNTELLEKVRYYLEHEDERKKIALAGRQRCLTSGYSHHDRLKYMLGKVSDRD